MPHPPVYVQYGHAGSKLPVSAKRSVVSHSQFARGRGSSPALRTSSVRGPAHHVHGIRQGNTASRKSMGYQESPLKAPPATGHGPSTRVLRVNASSAPNAHRALAGAWLVDQLPRQMEARLLHTAGQLQGKLSSHPGPTRPLEQNARPCLLEQTPFPP